MVAILHLPVLSCTQNSTDESCPTCLSRIFPWSFFKAKYFCKVDLTSRPERPGQVQPFLIAIGGVCVQCIQVDIVVTVTAVVKVTMVVMVRGLDDELPRCLQTLFSDRVLIE